MSQLGLTVTDEFAADALNAATDIQTKTPGRPINITRWGAVVTVVTVGATTVNLDKRITAGSDTGRIAGTTPLVIPAGAAPGEVYYVDENDGPIEINPGEEAVLEVTGAATSGNAVFFIENRELSFSGPRGSERTGFVFDVTPA